MRRNYNNGLACGVHVDTRPERIKAKVFRVVHRVIAWLAIVGLGPTWLLLGVSSGSGQQYPFRGLLDVGATGTQQQQNDGKIFHRSSPFALSSIPERRVEVKER